MGTGDAILAATYAQPAAGRITLLPAEDDQREDALVASMPSIIIVASQWTQGLS